MKVIIPLAGLGTRLRPHTLTKPKPLLKVAGKPLLHYIFEKIEEADIRDIIFIVGYLKEQIKEYVDTNWNFNADYLLQEEIKGQAHAVLMAKKHCTEDVIIWFADTIIDDADIKQLSDIKEDGMIFVKEVEDARRFGVVVPDENGIIKQLIEKPENPPSNLVNVGLYYVKDSIALFSAIEELIEKNMQTKGEFYLMDAFQIMIDRGAKFKTSEITVWEDCGKPETLLKTNQYFLDHGRARTGHTSAKITEPVYVEAGCTIEKSKIGPYVSVSKGAVIKNSTIKNSIINSNVLIEDSELDESIIGENTVIKSSKGKFNLGENSEAINENQ